MKTFTVLRISFLNSKFFHSLMFKKAALHSQYIYFKSSKKEMQKHGEPASEGKKKTKN